MTQKKKKEHKIKIKNKKIALPKFDPFAKIIHQSGKR
jgi:hypothetical protein